MKFFYSLMIGLVGLSCNAFSEEVQQPLKHFYNNPGIVAKKEGGVIGSDHLFNLTNQLGVSVEIVKPFDLEIPLSVEKIKEAIGKIFKEAGIQVITPSGYGDPAHPFFHMLLMLNPIEDGYVAYCQGRLFEEVEVTRVRLAEETTFQAITWETSNLIITPKYSLVEKVDECVEELTNNFVDRYKYYETLRQKLGQRRSAE